MASEMQFMSQYRHDKQAMNSTQLSVQKYRRCERTGPTTPLKDSVLKIWDADCWAQASSGWIFVFGVTIISSVTAAISPQLLTMTMMMMVMMKSAHNKTYRYVHVWSCFALTIKVYKYF